MFKVASVLSCLAVVANAAPHHNYHEGPYHSNQLQNAALFHKQDYARQAEISSHHLGLHQEHHQNVAPAAGTHHKDLAQSYANNRLISGPHQKVYVKAYQATTHHQTANHQAPIHSHYVPSHQTWSLPQMAAPIQHYEAPKFDVSTKEVVYTEGMKQSQNEETNHEIYHALGQAASLPKETQIVEENQEAHKGWEEFLKSQENQQHQHQHNQYEYNVKAQVPDAKHKNQETYNGWEEYLKNQKAQVPATGHQVVLHEAYANNPVQGHHNQGHNSHTAQYAQGHVSVESHNGPHVPVVAHQVSSLHVKVPFMANQQSSIQSHAPIVAHQTSTHQAYVPATAHHAHVPVVAHQAHVPIVAHQAHVPVVAHQAHVPTVTHQTHVPVSAHQAHVPTVTHQTHVPVSDHQYSAHEAYVEAPSSSHHADKHVDYYAHPEYKFEYGVNDPHTKDHKSQWEQRNGDVVKGAYTLDEADGTKRVVEYTADKKTGFNAVVKRTGHAFHPQIYGKPEPKTFHQVHNHQEEEQKTQEKHGH